MTTDAVTVHAAPRPYTLFPAPLLSIPIAASLTVLIAACCSVAPVRDAETLLEVSDVYLVRPIGYVLMAPLSDVFDAITLLSARQHVAGVLGLLGLWVIWRYTRSRRTGHSWWATLASFSALLACVAVAYVSASLLPRPMAYLASTDPDTMRIDFHSHTNFSRDAHQTFSVEKSRQWHGAGGYDAAYVTDHKALAEIQRRPLSAQPNGKRDVILLPGIEADWMGEHVGLLGPERTIRSMMSANLRDFQTGRFTACNGTAREPLLIWNHPRADQLEKLPYARCGSTIGLSAIELSNGALHGMDLVRWKRKQIVALARKHNLALTSGTDNHGWGYVAPNWTLLRVRGWRELSDDEVATQIERAIREHGFTATRVVERTTFDPRTSTAALILTVLVVPWRVLTTLSPDERLMWLSWIWAIAGVGLLRQSLSRSAEFGGPAPSPQPG